MRTQVILELFADAVVAAVCNILAGVIVLPALSSHKLRDALATTLLKLAASVSGYAGALLVLSLPEPRIALTPLLALSSSAGFDVLTCIIYQRQCFDAVHFTRA